MTALNKSQFLSAVLVAATPKLKHIEGIGDVYLKKMTVAEQGEIAQKTDKDKVDNVTASLYMVAYSVCDEHGKRLFGDNDIKELGKMNAENLTKLANAIGEINGFDVKHEDVKKN